jgi:hypothetical protein
MVYVLRGLIAAVVSNSLDRVSEVVENLRRKEGLTTGMLAKYYL